MTDADKKARLAAALRENLRKRKAQAREMTPEQRPGTGGRGQEAD